MPDETNPAAPESLPPNLPELDITVSHEPDLSSASDELNAEDEVKLELEGLIGKILQPRVNAGTILGASIVVVTGPASLWSEAYVPEIQAGLEPAERRRVQLAQALVYNTLTLFTGVVLGQLKKATAAALRLVTNNAAQETINQQQPHE